MFVEVSGEEMVGGAFLAPYPELGENREIKDTSNITLKSNCSFVFSGKAVPNIFRKFARKYLRWSRPIFVFFQLY